MHPSAADPQLANRSVARRAGRPASQSRGHLPPNWPLPARGPPIGQMDDQSANDPVPLRRLSATGVAQFAWPDPIKCRIDCAGRGS